MENKIKFIEPTMAISMLGEAEQIHTFRNSGGILFGAEWEKKDLVDLIQKEGVVCEIGGADCRRMGHGLVIRETDSKTQGDLLFVEVDNDKLTQYELKCAE